MTSPETPQQHPLVYVVTALDNFEDQVSPTVVGVYTTKERAASQARAYFEKASETFRDGAFEPVYGVEGQEDLSADLVLMKESPSKRVFLEVFGDDNLNSVVVAINAVHCNTAVDHEVPLLSSSFMRDCGTVLVDEPSLNEKGRKVHLLMAASGPDGWGEFSDPSLIGVFFTKEAALEAAKAEFAKHHDEDNNDIEMEITDNTGTIGDRGRVLSFRNFNGFSYGIAMDTFVPDEERNEGREMDLGLVGSGLYMHPLIRGHEEIEHKKPCSICKLQKNDSSYLRTEWDDENRVCRPCLEEMTKPCGLCKLEKKYGLYSPDQWNNQGPTCKDCLVVLRSKLCSVCNTERGQDMFTKREYKKADNVHRTCNQCISDQRKKQREEAQKINTRAEATGSPAATSSGQKRPAVAVTPVEKQDSDTTTTNNKKPKLLGPTKQCSACKVDKTKLDFSSRQWKKNMGDRRCKTCIEAEQTKKN